MRRLLSAFVVFALAGLLTFAASPANAAGPTPVDPLPDVPSRVVTLTQNSGGTWTFKEYMQILASHLQKHPGTVATIPKPITQPAQFARVGGVAAGSVLTAGQLGWAIGSNGSLAIIAVSTGTNYENVYCSQPEWYQGVTSFVNLSITPNCSALTVAPNADKPGQFTLSGGVWSTKNFIGPGGAFERYTIACGPLTNLPAGQYYAVSMKKSNGTTSLDFHQYSAVYSGTTYCGPNASTSRAWVQQTNPSSAGNVYPTLVSVNRVTAGGTILEAGVYTAPNPQRTARCRITWPGGGTTTGTGSTFSESDGVPMGVQSTGCKTAWDAKPGAGTSVIPSRIEVETEDDAGAKTVISDQTVPNWTPDQQKAWTNGNGKGLVLEKVVNGTTYSCMTWATDCSGWWTSTNQGTTPGPYRCTFGGAAIALTECNPYRTTFDTPSTTPTITDPTTGTSTGWTATPSPGNSLNPGTGPGTGVNPAAECFDSGWSEVQNPVDWVLLPVKCALVWAFVPRATVVNAGFVSLTNRWQSTAVGSLSTAVAGWSFVAPSSSGCDGILVPISQLGHGIQDFRILNACSGPLQPLATLSTVVIGISAVLTAVYAVTRFIGSIVGAPALAGGSSQT